MQLAIDTNLAHEYIQHCINNINDVYENRDWKQYLVTEYQTRIDEYKNLGYFESFFYKLGNEKDYIIHAYERIINRTPIHYSAIKEESRARTALNDLRKLEILQRSLSKLSTGNVTFEDGEVRLINFYLTGTDNASCPQSCY